MLKCEQWTRSSVVPARNASHSDARRHAFGKADGGQAGGERSNNNKKYIWTRSSVVERCIHIADAGGSNPSVSTKVYPACVA